MAPVQTSEMRRISSESLPGVKKGYQIPGPTQGGLNVRNMDISPTALHALGFKQPALWIGRPVLEIFE